MTSYFDVVRFFKSSFADKQVLPDALIRQWFNKAIASYSLEIEELRFNDETLEFDKVLNGYVIETLGLYMYKFYQERVVSLTNKRVSIVGKDISVDGSGNAKVSEREHLKYIESQIADMINKQKPTAYN